MSDDPNKTNPDLQNDTGDFNFDEPDFMSLMGKESSFEDDNIDMDFGEYEDDISEEDLAELQGMFKALEENMDFRADDINAKLGQADSLADDTESLDDKIKAALERDSGESESMTFVNETPLSFIEDVTIYDSEESMQAQEVEIEKKEKKKKKKFDFNKSIEKRSKKLSSKTLYTVVGCLLGLIICIGVVGIGFAISNNKKNAFLESGGIFLSQPLNPSNNGNYMFVGSSSIDKNTDVTGVDILKIKLDSKESIIYLKQNLNVKNHNIYLKDNNGKYYSMILDSMPRESIDRLSHRTELRMEPLDSGIKDFELFIDNPQTGEKWEFEFALEDRLSHLQSKYVDKKIVLNYPSDYFEIAIEDATFSSAGSKVNYSIVCKEEDMMPDIVKNKDKAPFSLIEGSREVVPLGNYFENYYFKDANTIVGTVEFEPLKDLNNKITFKFNDFFEVYEMNKEIPFSTVMSLDEENPMVMPVKGGNYDIVLEGGTFSRNRALIVFHTEIIPEIESPEGTETIPDPSLFIEEKTPNNIPVLTEEQSKFEATTNSAFSIDKERFERIFETAKELEEETAEEVPSEQPEKALEEEPEPVVEDILDTRAEAVMSATLVATTTDKELVAKGDPRYKKIGSDVLFEFPEGTNLGMSSLKLVIDNVKIKRENPKTNILLSYVSNVSNIGLKRHYAYIEENFNDRLKYKSGLVSFDEIKGFSDDIKSNFNMKNLYKPLSGELEDARYTTQVVCGTLENEVLNAIVKEMWYSAEEGDLSTDFYKTHSITAIPSKDNGWTIIRDEIIEDTLEAKK